MEQTLPTFACERCHATYVWKHHLAGRTARCKCGNVLLVPPSPQSARDDAYELVHQRAAAPSPAIAHAKRDIAYARQETLEQSKTDRCFPDRVKDLYLPLTLIAVGTVIEAGTAAFNPRGSIAHALANTGTYMILNTLLMLAIVFIVAKWRAISFGPLPTAILKLCGISIGPGAIGSVIGAFLFWIPLLGPVAGLLVGFVLYFATIGALFDLDESDTWAVVICVWLAKLAIVIGLVQIGR